MADVKEEALQCGCGKGETENHGSTPWIDTRELKSWPFWRAGVAEFVATFVFLYVSILTVMGVKRAADSGGGTCGGGIGVGTEGIAWAFGGTIFVLVYCTADVSGGHVNPAVSLGLLLARRVTLPRTLYYVFMQIFGAAAGAGVVKAVVRRGPYEAYGGGANDVAYGFSKGAALAAEIVGTFVLVYTVLAATDPRRPKKAAVLAPLAIGFAVFVVHLATIPVTGTGINPARSLGAALVYDRPRAWHHHWIFWVGPAIGAAIAAFYQHLLASAKTVCSA